MNSIARIKERNSRKLSKNVLYHHMNDKLPTVCINLMGSPGSGKSTLAAYIFARLKMLDVNCELVTEFAKDKVWENNDIALANQVYIFAKQYYRLYRCADKVDVIVTDSPLALTPLYNRESPEISKPLNELSLAVYNSFNNLTYFVKRVKKYNPVGRLETEEESNAKGLKLRDLLDTYSIKYKVIDGDLISADVIVQDIIEILKKGSDNA